MRIYGEYLDRYGRKVTVTMNGSAEPDLEIEIGDGALLSWAESPCETTNEIDDQFDHVMRQSATVRVRSRAYIPALFTASATDVSLTVERDGLTMFRGYLVPQAYNQAFVETEDELELNFIDTLSALQYYRWGDTCEASVDFDTLRANARQVTFLDIIKACAAKAGVAEIMFDGSRELPGAATNIFANISINELLMLGDDEEETWTLLDTLQEMMRYLNLRIMQYQGFWIIFDNATLAKGASITLSSLTGSARSVYLPIKQVIVVEKVEGTDTQITLGPVYNRISLNCDCKAYEDLISSPLESADLTSPYTNKQKYLTEILSHGEGFNAWNEFVRMCMGLDPVYKDVFRTDWYMQVKENIRWKFTDSTGANVMDRLCRSGHNQQELPNQLAKEPGAALLAFGKVEKEGGNDDNSPVSKIDMTDTLVISVNGNGVDTAAGAYPTAKSLQDRAPLAVYNGGVSGGVYSPSDDKTTNYLVITGKIALNPIMPVTCEWANRPKSLTQQTPMATVPSRKNDDGMFYTRHWWSADTPTAEPLETDTKGLLPFSDDRPQQYEFRASAIDDTGDSISKVGVIACMLVIGDKCVVETGTDGQPTDFSWQPYKTREKCKDDDEYYAQCFTIGFDPKIGDKLIGTEFDVQNNISYRLGLDTQGTAIPIRMADHVSGKVEFRILGPVNCMWNDVVRRHPTWFRHTSWTSDTVPLMAHVSSITIKDFGIEFMSDSGFVNNLDDEQLVYVSDTAEGWVNRKDDITNRMVSALTLDESIAIGVPNAPGLSTPLDMVTGYGVTAITDKVKGVTGKPEKLYVDSMWREHHLPRVLLDQTFADVDGNVSVFDRYTHPALPGKIFRVCGVSRDLTEGTARLNLKEIEQ